MASAEDTIKLAACHDYNTEGPTSNEGASLTFATYAGQWPRRLGRAAVEAWADGGIDGDPDLATDRVRAAVDELGVDRAAEIYCAEHDALANGDYEDE